jgi:hypothetical protein
MWLVFSKYEVEKKEVDERRVEGEASFLNLVEWVRGATREYQHNGMPMEDLGVEALSCLPKTNALRYQRMKAYGNHFRVNDCNMESMVSFDCGMASNFCQQQPHMGDNDAKVEYVGVI